MALYKQQCVLLRWSDVGVGYACSKLSSQASLSAALSAASVQKEPQMVRQQGRTVSCAVFLTNLLRRELKLAKIEFCARQISAEPRREREKN